MSTNRSNDRASWCLFTLAGWPHSLGLSVSLRVPRPQGVVTGLQTRQRDGRERPSVILTAARDLPFARVSHASEIPPSGRTPVPVCSDQQLL